MLEAMGKRRRMLVLLAVAAAAGVTVAGGWFVLRPPGINRRGFDCIEVGMSRPEVEAFLGGPPGDYSDKVLIPRGSCCIPLECVAPETDVSTSRPELWSANERTVVVYFHTDGTVADKEYMDFSAPTPSLWERLRRWFGL
jgi:hypothetical protein